MSALLSVCSTFFFPCRVHKSFLYICISIPALQIGSSVPFFYTQSDSVLFVRGFLTLQLGDLSPESGHFWLPQGPGCRWSGRTVAGPYTNNFVQTKKGAYSWWMPSSARVHGQQARQNWHLVSVCLLGHPHSPRAQLVCLGMVALRMSWGFLSFILKSSGGGERRGCFLGLSFLVFPWIQERNLGLFYQIRSI